MKRTRLFLGMLVCLLCVGAQAQWQWIDKDGRRVFSDRAPPADIPAKSILKQPGPVTRPAGFPVDAAAAAPANAASAPAAASANALDPGAPKLSNVDKELVERKKQADAAAAAKVRAEQEQVQKAMADNCARAKSSKAVFDSGIRVTQTNAKGEREFLDDNARAEQVKYIQTVIEANCK